MKKLRHTQGPWSIRYDTKWPFGVDILAPTNKKDFYKHVVSFDRVFTSSKHENLDDFYNEKEYQEEIQEQEANIKIVNAAPEMLEALMRTYEFWPLGASTEDQIDLIIKNAIEKATGLPIDEVLSK